jgi:hypothetical protein
MLKAHGEVGSGKPTDSPFYKGLMKVTDEFFMRGSMGKTLGFGKTHSLGIDPFVRNTPLFIALLTLLVFWLLTLWV